MTTGFSIFKDTTKMPTGDPQDADHNPIRTTQIPADAKAGAMSLSKTGSDHMEVENIKRPCRGHHY